MKRRNETLEARCRRVMLSVGWDLPFFLMPAACVTYEERPDLGTMRVNWDGLIQIDPAFAAGLSDRQLAWCICHELMHLLMLHHERSAGLPDKEKAGRAQDMAINQALDSIMSAIRSDGRPEALDNVYMPPREHRDKSSEELYHIIPNKNGERGGGAAAPAPGRGCGVGQGDGTSGGKNAQQGAGSSTGMPSEEQSRKWQEVAARARSVAGAGTSAGRALAQILTPPDPRVRWEQVLRGACSHALAAHGRDSQTWSKRPRRQPEDVLLPGWHANLARVAVAIDSSGSVSDEDLAQFVAEVVRISRIVQGVSIFLVVHDATVQWQGWLKASRPESVQRTLRGRGGTRFEPAYAAVGEQRGRFDALVHLTDGECFGRWPEAPKNVRRLVAALVGGHAQQMPVGTYFVRVEQ